MQNIIILRGIPGSSKSTWTQAFLKHHRDYVVVSRDGIRSMLMDHSNSPQTEAIVTKFYDKIFKEALQNKYNIILDNTHIRPKYITEALNVIESINPQAQVECKFFDVDVETCIERDSKRERVVGREVIEKMYGILCQNPQKNIDRLINEWKAKVRSKPDTFIKEWDDKLPFCIWVDIDGTLAHLDKDKRSPFEWAKVGLDTVDNSVKHLVDTYYQKCKGIRIIIVSGRDGICREETKQWLFDNNIQYHDLFMRISGDMRKDFIVKKEIYDAEIKGKYNILFALDDRKQVVDMLRGELGIKVFQVQESDF